MISYILPDYYIEIFIDYKTFVDISGKPIAILLENSKDGQTVNAFLIIPQGGQKNESEDIKKLNEYNAWLWTDTKKIEDYDKIIIVELYPELMDIHNKDSYIELTNKYKRKQIRFTIKDGG